MEPELLSLLENDLKALGLDLPQATCEQLLVYLDKVLKANETMNLTAITAAVEGVHKHLVDSLAVLQLKDVQAQLDKEPRWVDVGSGAGFPGLALALAVPGAQLDLVESTQKKAHFLNTTAAELGLLKRVQIHPERAELLAQAQAAALSAKAVPRGTASLRQSADAVFFRGVARLASLLELGAPLLKVGGLLVAYKGPKAGEELQEAAKALKELKMELAQRLDFSLPGANETRVLLCFRKLAETPKRFPRLPGQAQKEPLL